MTPTQARILRLLADRGMQTAATLATGASLSFVGTTMALQQMLDEGYVTRVRRTDDNYWLLREAGVDTLRASGVRG